MDYQMFTDFGNDAVDAVVRRARMLNMTWPQVLQELTDLSARPEFAEATDTAVREMVYAVLQFEDHKIGFYG
jgi:hypothetical protein